MEASDVTMEGKKQQHYSTQDDDHDHMANSAAKLGGWITSPFILGSLLALTITTGGWYCNLIVFVMEKFHMKSIEAAQVNNITSGLVWTLPMVAAILADSRFGGYAVALASSIISLLGISMFTMMVTIGSLRPHDSCDRSTSTVVASCVPSSSPSITAQQRAFLYIAIALATIGAGGTRFLLGSLGANQFDMAKYQQIFLNWFFVSMYVGIALGYSVLVYIESNLSWTLGFGISVGMNVVGIALIVLGSPFFRKVVPQEGSPFVSIARVLVAATVRKLKQPDYNEEYCYYYDDPEYKRVNGSPTSSLSFLNGAAIYMKVGNINYDTAKSWRLCSVEEVEDVKKVIRVLPVWGFGILYSLPIAMNSSFVVLQALAMDRHIGKHFKIPPSTFIIFTLIFSSIVIPILDRFLYPLWKNRLTIFSRGRAITPLQSVGIGHLCNVSAMVSFAVMEKKRLEYRISNNHQEAAAMSALWLALPLTLMGLGEAFEFPGETQFHFQELLTSLKSVSMALVSLRIAITFYLGAAVTSLLQHKTSWLPEDDINHGRLDLVNWMLSVLAFVNFICFAIYAKVYKYVQRS